GVRHSGEPTLCGGRVHDEDPQTCRGHGQCRSRPRVLEAYPSHFRRRASRPAAYTRSQRTTRLFAVRPRGWSYPSPSPRAIRDRVGSELMSSVTIGKYRLIAEIGRGGMAEVFLAVNSASAMSFSKLVVVKKLREHLASEADFMTMLIDEARIAARL